jgi:phage-related protein
VSSIANILLQVTGDSDDARRELEAVSRDLAIFGRETAEAEAELDTTGAKASLDELKGRLAEFSAQDYSTEINVQIAKAMADAAVLQAELERIDGENVTVDVDVRRGIVEKLASLTGQVERLGGSLEEASSGGISSFISGIGEAFSGASIFGVSLRAIAIAAPFVIAALVAVAGQLLAVVASAASAAGGVGALGIALGATLLPAFALIGGAIANFKMDSETAGTAAFALKENVAELGKVFTESTSGGSDALFKGLSDAVRNLVPLIDALKPAFTRLGQAGGEALRKLSAEFTSPGWQKFFTFLTDSLAKLTPLFARSFGAIGDILKNIATAAMPFLISGFKSVAGFLEDIGDKTSDIQGLRTAIGGMVDSLKAWGQLLGGIGDLTAALVEDFAPFGDSIVESLGEGAHNLADWLRSSKGLEKIKQFFQQTGPLASELGKLFLNIALALIQIGELVAPALTPVVRVLNLIFSAANKALSFLVDHFGEILKVVTAAIAPITVLVGLFGSLGSAASAAFSALSGAVKSAVAAVLGALRDGVGGARDAGRAIFNAVRDGFNTARGSVVSAARAIAHAAVEAVRAVIGAARSAGQAVFNAVRGGFNAARGGVVSAAHAIANAAVAMVRAVVGAARSAGSAVFNAVQGGFNAVRGAVVGAARDIAHGAVDAVKGLVGAATAAGTALGKGVASGISAAIGAVESAAKAIWNAVKSIVEVPLHIHIEVPSVNLPGPLASGVRDLPSAGLHLVGEEGPEFAFLPKGADVFTASDTRRMLRALAGGAASLASGSAAVPALALGGGGGGDIFHQTFYTPPTGNPDPEIVAMQMRLRGRRKGRR